MQDIDLVVTLPADLVASLGATVERATCAARQALILHLLRAGDLSQGRAATLLSVTRAAVLDLMTEHDIPSGPQTIGQHRRDVERAAGLVSNRAL